MKESDSHLKTWAKALQAENTRHRDSKRWRSLSVLRNKEKASRAEAESEGKGGGNGVGRGVLVALGVVLGKSSWPGLICFCLIVLSVKWRMDYEKTVQRRLENSSWNSCDLDQGHSNALKVFRLGCILKKNAQELIVLDDVQLWDQEWEKKKKKKEWPLGLWGGLRNSVWWWCGQRRCVKVRVWTGSSEDWIMMG